ncbi:MAG TPA: orotidine 5'-phosphate decarboxylase / HUMPS family protein [Desulfomonilaceae bacterium]|nr:orotidine 5'-phosphate decarboxylase / HUMPS family protein [Desulfomonilaceae bacterium]
MKDYAIILAADLPTSNEVLEMVKRVGNMVDGIKIGEATLLESGKDILSRIRDIIREKPLLVDLKIADIGFLNGDKWQGTNAKIIGSIEGSGATHVTVHGFPGPLSVAEATAVARQAGIGVLLLPLMSHAGAGLFFSRPMTRSELHYISIKAGIDLKLPEIADCTDATEAILLLGEALGVEGYIGPATRPLDLERYRRITHRPVWCPGFGRQDRQGRDLEEQLRQWSRIVGKASAAIIGSAIFAAADPAAAAAEIVELRDRVAGA